MIITIICLWMLAVSGQAIANTLAFRFKKSIFKNMNEEWWNPSKSWRNMYKNGKRSDGAKYLGSTTIFKFRTDAWNLFQFISHAALSMCIVMIFDMRFELLWWVCILLFLAIQSLYMITYASLAKYLFKQ